MKTGRSGTSIRRGGGELRKTKLLTQTRFGDGSSRIWRWRGRRGQPYPEKKISWVRYFVIAGFIIFVIAAILICFFLVQYLKPNDLPLTNSTLLSNSTKDPLFHLDFDEISEGVSFFKYTVCVLNSVTTRFPNVSRCFYEY